MARQIVRVPPDGLPEDREAGADGIACSSNSASVDPDSRQSTRMPSISTVANYIDVHAATGADPFALIGASATDNRRHR
jgi:hypothetical protein